MMLFLFFSLCMSHCIWIIEVLSKLKLDFFYSDLKGMDGGILKATEVHFFLFVVRIVCSILLIYKWHIIFAMIYWNVDSFFCIWHVCSWNLFIGHGLKLISLIRRLAIYQRWDFLNPYVSFCYCYLNLSLIAHYLITK